MQNNGCPQTLGPMWDAHPDPARSHIMPSCVSKLHMHVPQLAFSLPVLPAIELCYSKRLTVALVHMYSTSCYSSAIFPMSIHIMPLHFPLSIHTMPLRLSIYIMPLHFPLADTTLPLSPLSQHDESSLTYENMAQPLVFWHSWQQEVASGR